VREKGREGGREEGREGGREGAYLHVGVHGSDGSINGEGLEAQAEGELEEGDDARRRGGREGGREGGGRKRWTQSETMLEKGGKGVRGVKGEGQTEDQMEGGREGGRDVPADDDGGEGVNTLCPSGDGEAQDGLPVV
jgi:hypothetical protein